LLKEKTGIDVGGCNCILRQLREHLYKPSQRLLRPLPTAAIAHMQQFITVAK